MGKKILAIGLLGLLVLLSGCPEPTLESKALEFCGSEGVSAVYVCGDQIRVVATLEGAGITVYRLLPSNELEEAANCPVVAPDEMSEQCRTAIIEYECEAKQIC